MDEIKKKKKLMNVVQIFIKKKHGVWRWRMKELKQIDDEKKCKTFY